MANPISVPGHETDQAWEYWYGHPSGIRVTSGGPHAGAYHARMYLEVGGGLFPPFKVVTRIGQQLDVFDDYPRRLRFYYKLVGSMSNVGRMSIDVYNDHTNIQIPNVGSLIYHKIFFADNPVPSWTEFESGLISPPSHGRMTIIAVTSYPGPTNMEIANCSWYLDTWSFLTDLEDEDMTKRQEIRDAVVTTIESVTSPISLTGRVRTELQREDKIESFPEVHVLYGEENRRHNEMHRKKSDLYLNVLVWARKAATSAEQQLDELTGAVETKLEAQTGGQWLGLGYVDNVTVEDILPFELDSKSMGDVRIYRVDVRVTYRYNRLSP